NLGSLSQEGLSVSKSADLPARRSPDVAFVFNGTEVLVDQNQLVDLSLMWTAIGSPPTKKPSRWGRYPSTVEFVRSLADSLNVGIDHVWKTEAEQGAERTFGHRQIAMAYGEFLSPAFCSRVNEAFLEWARGEDDPDLLFQEAVEDYRRQGKD